MALPAAWVLDKTGFKNGMMIGLWVMAIGSLIFIPAAMARDFNIFLLGLFVQGTGLAILQTASNPYITIIGPRESAAKRISILGICNKVAGGIAPLVLAYYVLSDGDAFVENLKTMNEAAMSGALDELARRVINPYIVMAIVLVVMGVGIRLSPLPKIKIEEEEIQEATKTRKTHILQFPNLVLGALALFFYVGAEVIAGDTIIRYGNSLGIELEKAKAFTSYTMFFMVTGYILGIVLIPKFISQQYALRISAILGVFFSLAVIFTDGMTSVIFVALLGLANALVWPAVWPLAIHNLGKFISKGSAILIMAIAGGALIPLLWGKLSDHYSSQQAYWVLVPLYIYIFYYAIKGHKIYNWKE